MTVKIDGTNTEANPAFTGADTDTGLQCGTNEVKLVTGGTARATVDSDGDFGIGTASPSALLHIAKSSGNAKLLIQRSNTAANTNDYGSILWQSSAGNNNALIGAARHSAENDAYMFFSTANSGSLQERMRIGSDGSLGLNYSYPQNYAETKGIVINGANRSGLASYTSQGSTDTIGFMNMYADSGNGFRRYFDIGAVGSNTGGSGSESHIRFITQASGGNPAERVTIHSDGELTVSNQPIASLSDSRDTDLSNVVLTSSNFYNHTWVNQGNHFNATTGRFTCPVAGIYRIYFRCSAKNMNTNVRLQKNGTTVNEAYDDYASDEQSVSSEAIVSCAANDYLQIQVARLKAVGGTQHKQVTFQLIA